MQTFAHLLSGKVDVRTVLEHHGDLGQSIARNRAGVLQASHTCQGGFYREGDTLLCLQRRIAGGLGIDLDLDIGNVGDGIDRQATIAPDTKCGGAQNQYQDQPAMCDCRTNHSF